MVPVDFRIAQAKTTHFRCATRLILALLLLATVSCHSDSGGLKPAGSPVDFLVKVHEEHYVVRLVTASQIESARAIVAGTQPQRTISGLLADGDGGFNRDPIANKKWTWHQVSDSVKFVQQTTEVCDGLPSFVEKDKDEWLTKIKHYCPWKSILVKELK